MAVQTQGMSRSGQWAVASAPFPNIHVLPSPKALAAAEPQLFTQAQLTPARCSSRTMSHSFTPDPLHRPFYIWNCPSLSIPSHGNHSLYCSEYNQVSSRWLCLLSPHHLVTLYPDIYRCIGFFSSAKSSREAKGPYPLVI